MLEDVLGREPAQPEPAVPADPPLARLGAPN